MKALIISDSHSNKSNIYRIEGLIREQKIKTIIHLGDHARDGEEITNDMGLPVYAVAGNCDMFSQSPKQIIWRVGEEKVLLTHGDLLGVKRGLLRLRLAAQENGCKYAFYGHTHEKYLTNENGITLMNPGALLNGEYCIVDFENGAFSFKFGKIEA